MPQVSPAVQKASTAPSAALLAEGAATGTAEEGAAEGDPPEAAVIRVGDLYFCAPPCVPRLRTRPSSLIEAAQETGSRPGKSTASCR